MVHCRPFTCGIRKHSADIQMQIRADGSWWHEGSRIKRERLVKLFSRILRKDPDGQIYLVTPYEKVIVHVEDAPFVAVRVDRVGTPGRGAGPSPLRPILAMSLWPERTCRSALKPILRHWSRALMCWCAAGWKRNCRDRSFMSLPIWPKPMKALPDSSASGRKGSFLNWGQLPDEFYHPG